ncbi:uncharacterized protein [Physcomitrium patens]|uniref:CCT domain-containing protein n=1 Tax=Physcomitrium patens TaxID=3218 RepID=A0A2K1K054_PHYPA|nr:uncharacterized protein LOC112287405 [Physcomitrium patens]PNR47156.1 hypothetical protein PHYPA_014276 [Physcomitrium patens]|eukprot:XP_024386115.1 uncharacterized protein LOC112287405 [Physcomitrella patens]
MKHLMSTIPTGSQFSSRCESSPPATTEGRALWGPVVQRSTHSGNHSRFRGLENRSNCDAYSHTSKLCDLTSCHVGGFNAVNGARMSTAELHSQWSHQDGDVPLVDLHNAAQLGEDSLRETSFSSSILHDEVREETHSSLLFPEESHHVVVPNGDHCGDRSASESGFRDSGSNMIRGDVDHHVPEMEISWGATEDDKDNYCLDLWDIVGDDIVAQQKQNGRVDDEGDNAERGNEILKIAFISNECKTEMEFCAGDGLNVNMDLTTAVLRSSGLEGGQEELAELGKHIVHSLLRLNYDDVLAAWCHDRSLWTDGKRLQTVPEHFTFDDTAVDDFSLVPKPVTSHPRKRADSSESRDRDASVMRYREKKRSRVSSNKVRYQVRKFNAECRPRLKGRFAKRTYHTAMTQ